MEYGRNDSDDVEGQHYRVGYNVLHHAEVDVSPQCSLDPCFPYVPNDKYKCENSCYTLQYVHPIAEISVSPGVVRSGECEINPVNSMVKQRQIDNEYLQKNAKWKILHKV